MNAGVLRTQLLMASLEQYGLPYNMYGMLQLDLFNPCSVWDIFYKPKDAIIHTRVKNVMFRMKEGLFRVGEFESCHTWQRHGLMKKWGWVPTNLNLNMFLFNEIGGSQALHSDEGDKLRCVVFPRRVPFTAGWMACVFYPRGIEIEDSNNPQVIGWRDGVNPIYNFQKT